MNKLIGTVTFINHITGSGTITCGDVNYLMHKADIKSGESLKVGDEVMFEKIVRGYHILAFNIELTNTNTFIPIVDTNDGGMESSIHDKQKTYKSNFRITKK